MALEHLPIWLQRHTQAGRNPALRNLVRQLNHPIRTEMTQPARRHCAASEPASVVAPADLIPGRADTDQADRVTLAQRHIAGHVRRPGIHDVDRIGPVLISVTSCPSPAVDNVAVTSPGAVISITPIVICPPLTIVIASGGIMYSSACVSR